MEENLVGYLLKALDPVTEHDVEAYLQKDAEAVRRLELLRSALVPLEADAEEIELPDGLRQRTLALVAEHRLSNATDTPDLKAPPVLQMPMPRSRWLRSDALIAASILLLLLPMIPPALSYMHQQQNVRACQENMRGFFFALSHYGDLNEQRLPMASAQPPHNYAGMVVPTLYESRLLGPTVSIRCPGNGVCNPPLPLGISDMDQESTNAPAQFEQDKCRVGGCYAYSLGYQERGEHRGIRFGESNAYLPIMADRPPFEQTTSGDLSLGNSTNHGGAGQNVLYLDGNVSFCTSRHVGVNRDDIYLNRNRLPEAGLDDTDSVLGGSSFQPYPAGMPNN
jgi:hypothetical protein